MRPQPRAMTEFGNGCDHQLNLGGKLGPRCIGECRFAGKARIVDQHIDGDAPAFRKRHDGRRRGGIVEVGGKDIAAHTMLRTEFSRQLLQALLTTRDQQQRVTVSGEVAGKGGTDAGGSAGDQRGMIGSRHRVLNS